MHALSTDLLRPQLLRGFLFHTEEKLVLWRVRSVRTTHIVWSGVDKRYKSHISNHYGKEEKSGKEEEGKEELEAPKIVRI